MMAENQYSSELRDLMAQFPEASREAIATAYVLGMGAAVQRKCGWDTTEWRKFRDWQKEQDAKVAASQKNSGHPFAGKQPYYGASGGAYTYTYTPTSLGCVVKVKNSVTDDTLDLTDWDSW